MRTKQSAKIVETGIFIISAGIFATIVILAFQAYFWIENGKWLPLQFYEVLQNLNIDFTKLLDMDWQWLQKLIFWVLERPLWLIVFIFSISYTFSKDFFSTSDV